MSKTVTLSFSDEQKVHVEPCDCCERTTIVIETSECLVRLGGLTPAELIELADALSDVAFDGDYIKQAPTGRGSGYFWVWHRQRTVAALEAAGHRPASDSGAAAESRASESAIHRPQGQLRPSPQARLIGPFEAQQRSENGYQIVSADGSVSVWAYGQSNAEKLVFALNLLHRHGAFQ